MENSTNNKTPARRPYSSTATAEKKTALRGVKKPVPEAKTADTKTADKKAPDTKVPEARPSEITRAESGRVPRRSPKAVGAIRTTDIDSKLDKNIELKKDREWNEAVIRTRTKPDRVLITLMAVLLCLGTVMVFSASYPTALKEMNDGMYYLKRQFLFVGLGLAAMIAAGFVPYKWIKKFAPVFYGIGILFLIAVLFIGTAEGVAKRWIYIGPISFQPSEYMKFAMVVMVAWYIDKYRDIVLSKNNPKFKKGTRKAAFISYFQRVGLPCIIIGAPCVLVLLEKHLSGTLILGIIGVTTLVIGGVSIKGSMSLIGIGGAGAAGAFLALNPYAMDRILNFTDGNSDIQGGAWQTIQGLYAIGSGGLLGLGLGCSNLKHSYIYAAHTDFIFSIWCEEMGFVGAIFLMLIYLAFIWRGFIIAMRAPDTFSSLVVFGIIGHVAVQVLANIAVVTGLFPNTGITLPFFSYGGTSTVILLAEMGVVLSISRHSYQRR